MYTETIDAETIDLTTLPAMHLPYYLHVVDAGFGRRYWTLLDRASGQSVGFDGSTGPESQISRIKGLYGVAPTAEQAKTLIWWAYQTMTTTSI